MPEGLYSSFQSWPILLHVIFSGIHPLLPLICLPLVAFITTRGPHPPDQQEMLIHSIQEDWGLGQTSPGLPDENSSPNKIRRFALDPSGCTGLRSGQWSVWEDKSQSWPGHGHTSQLIPCQAKPTQDLPQKICSSRSALGDMPEKIWPC